LLDGGQSQGAEWPHFRGPGYDGNSPDGQIAGEGVTEVWSTGVDNGSCSVTIVAGKLFTMGNEEGSEHVICLDAATGNEVWRFVYECELNPRLYPGGPNATPTVVDGRVYTISRVGHIYCLDAADGKKVWESSAQPWAPKGGWWGFSGSATIVGDLAVFNVGDKGLALDKATGKTVWSSEKPAKAYATVVPLPDQVFARPALVVQTTTNIHFVDPQSGEPVFAEWADWQTRVSNCNGVTPRWYDGCLYVMHGKFGLSKLSLSADGSKETWLCEAANFGRDDWFAFNQQVYLDGYTLAIVGGSKREGVLICVNVKSGVVEWQEPTEFGNLLLAGNTLVILSQTGELSWGTLDRGEYDERQRMKLLKGDRSREGNGLYWPYPVLVDGHLYAKTTKGHLTCLTFK
jgi:outer membrane protein assembly factor BamB